MKNFTPIAIACLAASCHMLSATQAIAGTYSNNPVRCQYIQGSKVQIDNICVQNGASWAGGGGMQLKWEDGVSTTISFGLQGTGTEVCPGATNGKSASVDGVCGRLFKQEINIKANPKNSGIPRRVKVLATCVSVKGGAICWAAQ